MDSLSLTLVTPFQKVFEGVEVTEIKIPAEKGQITIYPDHSPLVTTLDTGLLSYKVKGETVEQTAVITWGYCEVMDKEVKLLADTVSTREEVDLTEAQQTKKNIEAKLATNKVAPEEIKELQQKLKKAEAEIALVSK